MEQRKLFDYSCKKRPMKRFWPGGAPATGAATNRAPPEMSAEDSRSGDIIYHNTALLYTVTAADGMILSYRLGRAGGWPTDKTRCAIFFARVCKIIVHFIPQGGNPFHFLPFIL